ncbi:MAG: 4Fe-4S binding protein [Bacteroidia bacterium]
MKIIKHIGLAIFLFALGLFIALLFMARYEVAPEGISTLSASYKAEQKGPLEEALTPFEGTRMGKLDFYASLSTAYEQANNAINARYGLNEASLEKAAATISGSDISEEAYATAIASLPNDLQKTVGDWTGWLKGKTYESNAEARKAITTEFKKAGDGYAKKFQLGDLTSFRFEAAKTFGTGWFWENKGLFTILTLLLGILGALMYIFPAFFDGMPGIKHNGIYFSSATNRGLIGILAGIFLIGFYILLYFNHDWIAEWIAVADPVTQFLKGKDASQWDMYGLLYTLAIVVMGIRMFAKYRHNNYHKVRTASIIFFQVAFAFLIPAILYQFNLPETDLKNAWPLDYDFFFDWNIENHIKAGTMGIFMFVWGIVLTAILIPLFTYFFGKRWYCSWVCGCGGLAETLGDPYRQLSDKSVKAWKVERWLIHSVLVFAVVMTLAVIYTYFQQTDRDLSFLLSTRMMMIYAMIALAAIGFVFWRLYQKEKQIGKAAAMTILGTIVVLIGFTILGAIMVDFDKTSFKNDLFFIDSNKIRSYYGFAIGSIFAGVVGTGFYPLMGNRVWCRFGCPLAAYMGLVQRFKSRFRITTNGGQCISCGNCSTYCEMGIDVRAYAQRGQNIVRSSCVGCGVCAAVCPRGVLSLENGPDTPERIEGLSEVKY